MKTRLISVMLCVVVLLSLTACRKNTLPPLAEGLEPPFLQDVERVPHVSTLDKETVTYDGDVQKIPNKAAWKFFDTFQIPFEDMKEATVEVDDDGRTVYQIWQDGFRISFDTKGNLVEFFAIEAYWKAEKDEYRYTTQEDVQDVLDSVKRIMKIPNRYELEFHQEEDGLLGAVWYKRERDGTQNRYDNYSVYIKPTDGRIHHFHRQTGLYKMNATTPLVTEEQALAFVQADVGDEGGTRLEYSEPSLGYMRPNFRFEEGGPYEEATFIRLAWSVVVSRPQDHEYDPGGRICIVHVDARTGEILGGDVCR